MEASWSRQQLENARRGSRSSRVRSGVINPESEMSIQIAFIEWIDLMAQNFPELRLCFAVPNTAKRGKMDGWLMTRSGTRRGVPDICLPVESRMRHLDDQYHGLWIEMKSAKGTLTPEQKMWIERLREVGHRVEVCRSWTAAADVVIEYLNLPIARYL